MRENGHFVRSTDVSALEPTLIGDTPAITHYRAMIDRIEALAGRDAALLFAEPVLPAGAARKAPAVSWYCAFEGAVAELDSIDEIARKPVVDRLSARLQALLPALRDPEIGEALGAWLNIAASSDIVSVGGEPVLIEWGFLPPGVATDGAARANHFFRTLGRFAPNLTAPPARAAALTAAGESRRSDAPQAPFRPPLAPPASPETAAMSEIKPEADKPPGFAAAAPPPPPLWRAPLVACALAAIGLIILLLPGVLKFPVRNSTEQDAVDLQRLRAANESLEAQLKALQGAARDRVCRGGDPNVGVPGNSPGDPPLKMELLPRPPDQVPLPGRAVNGAADSATIASLLDDATVLVFAAKTENSGMQGTGFFINDRNIVTNRHVVENGKAGGIVVASRALGGVKPARLIGLSNAKAADNSVNVDLAVLEIEPTATHASLAIGATPAKLSTVYIAGFPGFITERDVAFDNFLRKLSENPTGNSAGSASEDKALTMPSPDLRYGRVSNIIRSGPQDLPIILHDMQLAPGHSGGPLVDACGRVGGVNSWDIRPEEGPQQANVAQDVTILSAFLKDRNIAFNSNDGPCSNTPAVPQPAPTPPAPK
jgi:S1-C subfamily serine protease